MICVNDCVSVESLTSSEIFMEGVVVHIIETTSSSKLYFIRDDKGEVRIFDNDKVYIRIFDRW